MEKKCCIKKIRYTSCRNNSINIFSMCINPMHVDFLEHIKNTTPSHETNHQQNNLQNYEKNKTYRVQNTLRT